MTRWGGESNERVYERFGMGTHVIGVNCRVVKWVKRNNFRWFGYITRTGSEKCMKKVYTSETVCPNRRGRSLGRWKDKIKECMCERGATRGGGLDQARKKYLDRAKWRLFCFEHPPWRTFLEGVRHQSYRQTNRYSQPGLQERFPA